MSRLIAKLCLVFAFSQVTCSPLPEEEEEMRQVLTLNPPSTNPDDIHFLLWTRQNQGDDQWQELRINDTQVLQSSNYNRQRQTLVYAHGWTSDGRTEKDVLAMKNEMLINGDWNFITVDWQELARGLEFYLKAKANVPLVGERLAQLIDFLVWQGETPSENVRLVGHSLGAHVVGIAAKSIRSGVKLQQITGLDPAKPGFESFETSPDRRLEPTDAVFVQVIHTMSGTASLSEQLGTIDFYVNGGRKQPGCNDPINAFLAIQEGESPSIGVPCSHNRAIKYFIESINSARGFVAAQCDSWDDFTSGLCDSTRPRTLMGLPVSTINASPGAYYLCTSKLAPFALGEQGLDCNLINDDVNNQS